MNARPRITLLADVMYSELAFEPSAAPTPLMVMPGSAFETTGSVFGCAPGSV